MRVTCINIFQHFSPPKQKITVKKQNFCELVTIQRRYPRCELKIVPRLEPQTNSLSDQKLPAPSDPSQTEENDELEDKEDINDSQECTLNVSGEPKRTPKTPKKPKQSAKSVASAAPP